MRKCTHGTSYYIPCLKCDREFVANAKESLRFKRESVYGRIQSAGARDGHAHSVREIAVLSYRGKTPILICDECREYAKAMLGCELVDGV